MGCPFGARGHEGSERPLAQPGSPCKGRRRSAPRQQRLDLGLKRSQSRSLAALGPPVDPAVLAENIAFLKWLKSDHFVFLGAREYQYPRLPNGDYEVAYRVVYSDGHSEERSFDFAVDDPAAPAAGTAPQGCGTAVAGASTAASPEATAGQGDAASADATAQADGSDAAQPADSDALPAWVWVAGIAGLAVLVVAFLLMGRRARALGHLDDGR